MMRRIGSLTETDLGMSITAPKTPGVRRRPLEGVVSSVRHFVVDGGKMTGVIIRVPKKGREPDHREIGPHPSDTEVEVAGNG